MGRTRASAGILLTLAMAVSTAMIAPPVLAQSPPDGRPLIVPVRSCDSLAGSAFPDPTTVILSATHHDFTPAEQRQAGDVRPFPPAAAMPPHCEIVGKLQERQGANGQTYAIKFHLRMPDAWNGRFFFQGGGGSDGNLGDATGMLPGVQGRTALGLGYAVISTDAGHDNTVNNDPKLQGIVTFGWDAEARHNYGYAAIGPTARVGKALIKAFYGRAQQFAYFVGTSKGGQEAMMAVQRFPQEFDGAVVGYPGFHLAYASLAQLWDGQVFAELSRKLGFIGADGLPLINKAMSDDDIILAQGAILKACDRLDGTADGMIENFTACTARRVVPELAKITCRHEKSSDCLLPIQVAALRKVYGGPIGRRGQPLYSDWAWDAGIGVRNARGVSQGWRIWKMGSYDAATNNGNLIRLGAPSNSAVFRSPPVPVAADVTSLTRYALSADLDAAYAASHVKWGRLNEAPVDFMHADSVDLSAFTSRGGKIILFQGVSDPVFSIKDTLRWLAKVNAREKGHASRFLRFYAIPGMNHGRGGPSTDRFDMFSALVAWREQGTEPGAIIATAGSEAPWQGRTRLLCPYPQRPRRFAADIESAASFRCVNVR